MAKVFLVGMMGVGKTSRSKQWGARCGLQAYDLDKLIEDKERMPISAVFEQKGETYFRDLESETLRLFAEKDNFILATGGGAPCFNDNIKWMNERGITIWLHEHPNVLVSRLKRGKAHRPLIKNLDDCELKKYIEDKLNEREVYYSKATYQLIGNHIKYENFKKLIS